MGKSPGKRGRSAITGRFVRQSTVQRSPRTTVNESINLQGAMVLFVLVAPGIVFEVARTRLTGYGPRDREVATRIVQAVLVSVIFDLLYLTIFGQMAVHAVDSEGDGLQGNPRRLGLTALGLGIVVPAIVAQVVYGGVAFRRPAHRRLRWLPPLPHLRQTPYERTPTAWDRAAVDLCGHWVRVRLADGKWVGGWYSGNSYVSTYPEPRDIYIEDQHEIAQDGSIGAQIPNTAGVWVPVSDTTLVEWIKGEFPA